MKKLDLRNQWTEELRQACFYDEEIANAVKVEQDRVLYTAFGETYEFRMVESLDGTYMELLLDESPLTDEYSDFEFYYGEGKQDPADALKHICIYINDYI